jgi:HAD superfamily phosphatase (TIGR01668 family)
MPISFLPKVITKTVTDIRPDWLKSRNIRLLMLDFDNTIVPYTTNTPTEAVENWLKELLASDIQLCVVSNSKRNRVKIFCEEYGMDCITHAKKPFSKGIRECLDRYGIPADQAALAGDQIYTDTLGGNGCGVTSILVEAIDNHNFWLKARHVLELPFIYLARKRRMHHEES